MKLLIHSANLGNFDKPKENVEQILPPGIDLIETHTWTDSDFPPRFNSMTPRLQARIPKMTAWQMKPGYDYYLWLDASCRLPREDSVQWFLDKLGSADIVVFKHNKRGTVGEEAEYLRERLELEKAGTKQPYVLPRYENERLEEQMALVDPEAELYASTAFIYRDTTAARDLLTIWWTHTSLFHSIDQLSLPHAIQHSDASVNVMREDYLKCKFLEYTR